MRENFGKRAQRHRSASNVPKEGDPDVEGLGLRV